MPESTTKTPHVSVVIPVYNKSACVSTCISSLARQTAKTSDFEVILVDDGSTDDSLDICRKEAERHPFIRVIAQENQGVSGARNTGIQAAAGKYIMFLDSDDTIGTTTIELIIKAFESFGDAVDVVAYQMRYYYPSSGNTTYHKRETWLTETGVYSLDEYPFIAQSTMNVCVRNRGADNILFIPSIKMGEDQLFITQNLVRKKAIGYCKEAYYQYVRDGSNASMRGNNPLYAFGDMMALYGYLVDLASADEGMAHYAYQLVLYNFAWRIKSGILFPTVPDPELNAAQCKELERIVRAIPLPEICESPYLEAYHKAMLFDHYSLVDENAEVEYAEECASLRLNDGTVWETVIPKIILERCRLEHDTLSIRGRFVCPTFLFEPKPTLAFEYGGMEHPIELGGSSFEYCASKYKTGKAWSFERTFDLAGLKMLAITIRATVGGKPIPSIGMALTPTIHNGRLGWNRIMFRGATLVSERSALTVTKTVFGKYQREISLYEMVHPKQLARRIGLRTIDARFIGKRIWLYTDLPTSPSKGNALIQMLHDLKMNDGIDRFYVSNYREELTLQYPELEGHIVRCQSRLHQALTLRSELVLSSYLERFVHRPMKQPTYNHIGDLATRQRRVYLQHGILHAHMPWYFSYDRTLFDYEVISTEFERTNLINNYHFPKTALIDSGAPRLDAILPVDPASRRIVFAPSWRAYLVTGKASERTGIDSAFEASSLYQGIRKFFELVASSGILERYGYSIDLKLHPNFSCYEHMFEFDNPRINLVETINEGDYKLVITDFSSYVFDFVYAGSDVMYFLPDHIEFEAGLNHYSQLDLPFDKGFGPYCETAEEAFEALSNYLEGAKTFIDNREAGPERGSFFLHHDGKNTERLYAKLVEIADNLRTT